MAASLTNRFHAVLMIIPFISHTISATTTGVAGKSSTEFIKTSCTATTNPSLCYTPLSSHASVIQTSPKLLAHTALSVAFDTARSTSATISWFSQSHGMRPRDIAAIRDCVEELSDTVDQLRRSMGEMSQLGGSKLWVDYQYDIQTWVSAALTDEDTCSDGFGAKGMTDKLKIVVRAQIVKMSHMTSNALALINYYAFSPRLSKLVFKLD